MTKTLVTEKERYPLLFLNPSVAATDEQRLKEQAVMIYDHLRHSPLTTRQLSELAPQYNARIHEIRRFLKETQSGLTVLKQKISAGMYRYWIGRTGNHGCG